MSFKSTSSPGSSQATSREGSMRNLVSAANADYDVVEDREASRLAAHQQRLQGEKKLQEEREEAITKKANQHHLRVSSLKKREALKEYVLTVLIEKALVVNKDNP